METSNIFLRAFIRQAINKGCEPLEKELPKIEQAASELSGTIEETVKESQAKED